MSFNIGRYTSPYFIARAALTKAILFAFVLRRRRHDEAVIWGGAWRVRVAHRTHTNTCNCGAQPRKHCAKKKELSNEENSNYYFSNFVRMMRIVDDSRCVYVYNFNIYVCCWNKAKKKRSMAHENCFPLGLLCVRVRIVCICIWVALPRHIVSPAFFSIFFTTFDTLTLGKH